MFLEIENISKQIGAEEVLKDITISMDRGRVYGLQGKNGCGKSMLMRVICGLVLPTSGKVVMRRIGEGDLISEKHWRPDRKARVPELVYWFSESGGAGIH